MTAIDKVLMTEMSISLLEQLAARLCSRRSIRWMLVTRLIKTLRKTVIELKRNTTNEELDAKRRDLWNDYCEGILPFWLADAWTETLRRPKGVQHAVSD